MKLTNKIINLDLLIVFPVQILMLIAYENKWQLGVIAVMFIISWSAALRVYWIMKGGA